MLSFRTFLRHPSFAAFPLLLLIFLQGCVFTPKAIDGQSLTSNQGLLVVKLTSNVNVRMGYLDFKSESTFSNRFAENMVGPKGFVFAKAGDEQYTVIPLEAGDYMWSKIEVYPMFAWLHASNKFKVVAGTITYIGDVRVHSLDRRFTMQVTDREHAMREFMAASYPGYLNSMRVVTSLADLRLY